MLILAIIISILVVLYLLDKNDKVGKLDSNFKPTRILVGNPFMSPKEKQEYLSSIEWNILRAVVLSRDKHCCQHCNSTNNLEVHHITYENLGAEKLDQLVTVCRNCHQQIHDKLGYDRVTEYPISILKE